MKIAYAKLGRSVLLDPEKWGAVGGDNEPVALLRTLAERNPDVEWVIAGRHSGPTAKDGKPIDLPPNVTVPELPPEGDRFEFIRNLYADVDGAVIWLGQHGTSNNPIPKDKNPAETTSPQEMFRNYSGAIIRGLNDQDRRFEPTWLCADPRNYLKARDLKWYPTLPVLGQFDWHRIQRHYRWEDPRPPHNWELEGYSEQDGNSWKTKHFYRYSGLELTGVPTWEASLETPPWSERSHFGVIMNEARDYVSPAKARAPIARAWVNPLDPAFFHGKWTEKGQGIIQRTDVEPIHYTEFPEVMASARTTLTTPSSGSGWATAKPWECFALGTICFFHPHYDTQGHIIPTIEQAQDLPNDDPRRNLAAWLRPREASEFHARVQKINDDPAIYEWLRELQLWLLRTARWENKCVLEIESRLYPLGRERASL